MFYEDRLQTGTKERPCYLLTVHNTPTAILFAHVQGDENSLVVSTKEGNENSVANRKEAEQAVSTAIVPYCTPLCPTVLHCTLLSYKHIGL